VASSTGLGTINITYPGGWAFNAIVNYGGSRPWSAVHDWNHRTLKLSGPNLLIGEYVWIILNMTTQSSGADPVNWNATAWDVSGTLLGTQNLPVTVDGQRPTITITQPPDNVYYTVSAGKKIWINGTVEDDLNITKYGRTPTINDTRFEMCSLANYRGQPQQIHFRFRQQNGHPRRQTHHQDNGYRCFWTYRFSREDNNN